MTYPIPDQHGAGTEDPCGRYIGPQAVGEGPPAGGRSLAPGLGLGVERAGGEGGEDRVKSARSVETAANSAVFGVTVVLEGALE